jgi:hypothetical protein
VRVRPPRAALRSLFQSGWSPTTCDAWDRRHKCGRWKNDRELRILTTRCPVFRRRDSHLGFRTELETLVGHAKGKGTSGGPARLKVPMGQSGADRPIVVMKRGNARGAKGVGHSRRLSGQRETGGTRCLAGRRQPSLSGTSRGFRTSTPQPARPSRKGPASETLHRSGRCRQRSNVATRTLPARSHLFAYAEQ